MFDRSSTLAQQCSLPNSLPKCDVTAAERAMKEITIQANELAGSLSLLESRLAPVLNASCGSGCVKCGDGPSAACVDSPLVQWMNALSAQLSEARNAIVGISTRLDV